jgi:adenylate kinase
VYIILLGAPGAGKGTQAAELARQLGLVHIATGDLFRQALEQGTELGVKAKSYMEKGALDKALARQGKAIDRVIYIKVSEEELLKRLSGRWICRRCQTPYHVTDSPPKVWGKCDKCGGELYQRPDDTEQSIKKRLEVYSAETAPLIDYYARRGKLLEIEGEGSVAEVGRKITTALEEGVHS